ncbi:MAG: thioesterase family protein [Bacteroidetes bacterium]|nr:thioesterase family protein [Bacteroidota bacterium]MBS1756130.1 thioesterase family protein [Bacteroidota bacterium]
MPRVKLTMPENYLAVISIPVRITDINYGNHLGNDSLVSILHEARVQWLAQNNYTELNIEGRSLIMADLMVEYKKECFFGDILEIKIAVGDITSISFSLYYTVCNQKNILIALAKTGMVFFDYSNKKITPMPEKFQEKLSI